MLNDKTILVTGGTGSFGKKFIKTVFERYEPKKVIVYSRDQLKQFDMQNSDGFNKHIDDKRLRYFIGDVCDLSILKLAIYLSCCAILRSYCVMFLSCCAMSLSCRAMSKAAVRHLLTMSYASHFFLLPFIYVPLFIPMNLDDG